MGSEKGHDQDAVEDAERCIRANEEVDEEALVALCEKEPLGSKKEKIHKSRQKHKIKIAQRKRAAAAMWACQIAAATKGDRR